MPQCCLLVLQTKRAGEMVSQYFRKAAAGVNMSHNGDVFTDTHQNPKYGTQMAPLPCNPSPKRLFLTAIRSTERMWINTKFI